MRKIPCELTLGNGGDVIVMVALDDTGTLHIPRHALYGSFQEGVLTCRVMRPEDQACVRRKVWVDSGPCAGNGSR
jgi:hypothetical protein